MDRTKIKKIVLDNPVLKLVPNTLTLCNSLCGFAAILWALRMAVITSPGDEINLGLYAVSAWIILFAMVFDALDGFTARIFNAASLTGLEMDSLSDMLTFGAAPAIIISTMVHRFKICQTGGDWEMWGELCVYALCAVYLGGAALRLAKYNVTSMQPGHQDTGYFSGIPSPGAAAALCSLIICLGAMQDSKILNLAEVERYYFALPIYAAVLGLLMVSPAKYLHIGKWLAGCRRHPKRLIAVGVFIALLALAFWQFGLVGLSGVVAVAVTLYVVSGFIIATGHTMNKLSHYHHHPDQDLEQ